MSGRNSAGLLPIPVAADVNLGTANRRPDHDQRAFLHGRDSTVRTTSIAEATDDSLRLYLYTTKTSVAPLGVTFDDQEQLAMTRAAVEAELRRRVVLGRSPATVLEPVGTMAVSATKSGTGGKPASDPTPSSSPPRGKASAPRPRYGGRRFTLSAQEKQVIELWDRRNELGLPTYHELLEHLGRKGIPGWTHKRIEALMNRVAKKRKRDALRADRRT